MFRSEAVDTAARGLLDRRKAGASGVRAESEIWCSAMGVVDKSERRSSTVIDPVCGRLRSLFDDVTRTPMPDQLELLAEKLDAALERGDLTKPKLR